MSDRVEEAVVYYLNTTEHVIPSDMNQSYGEECLGAVLYQKFE